MKHFDYKQNLDLILPLLKDLQGLLPLDKHKILQLQKRHTLDNGNMLSKTDIIAAYKGLAGSHGLKEFDIDVVRQLRMKPIRTISGVAPVTVLTKPYPCPGQCIFCPVDVRMPKSYLASEPGAQRAENNFFDPYLQTYNRINTLHEMGHPIDKVELIVLGGTWSVYSTAYQIWFVKECFRAMNDFKNENKDDRANIEKIYQRFQKEISKLDYPVLSNDRSKNEQVFSKYQIHGEQTEANYNQLITDLFLKPEKEVGLTEYQTASWGQLEKEQQLNETSGARCVGLVLETRPDEVDKKEVVKLRRLGCTKVQIGLQSLQDKVLEKNKRGHDVACSAQAMELLRLAGFKIHAHWMSNLYGSDVAADKKDYLELFTRDAFKPDELKIYPCSLIESAQLMKYYKDGLWKPYSHEELLEIVTFCLTKTPPYCRLTRVIRDISSFDIVAGNKKTNFRQIAQDELEKFGLKSANIRAREIRHHQFNPKDVKLNIIEYQTTVSKEMFLQFVVEVKIEGEKEQKLLGFLRLSLPRKQEHEKFVKETGLEELTGAAMIREVHVYGQLVGLGEESDDEAQHLGLGTTLLEEAEQIAQESGYKKLAVISAIGTRKYYQKRGFEKQGLYQVTQIG
ncbi:MAG: tRNA uridine(34) 5-carboxymethylaminomethyl modification radical SAM/GNAT enzyme Elp3 [Patescibacteria group bacterium]|nr:tRNA uridine(34) 5-carboxymethylaminomethyl modification radical SAM/GNAT enzyme Elp3 [Patescibacteria group bacterium]